MTDDQFEEAAAAVQRELDAAAADLENIRQNLVQEDD